MNNDTTFASLSKEEIEEITNKLGNIAKNNLAWSVQLEHAVVDYQGHAILFIRIAEQTNKPIYLRGKDIYKAYIRSAGHTVKMSKEQVHELIAQSHGLSFEDRVAKSGVSQEEVENLLDCPKMFELLGRNIPSDRQQMMKLMEEYGLITERDDLYDILNLGAILFAKQLKDFPTLKGKEVIVRRYQGTNNRILFLEYICQTGYAMTVMDIVIASIINTTGLRLRLVIPFLCVIF